MFVYYSVIENCLPPQFGVVGRIPWMCLLRGKRQSVHFKGLTHDGQGNTVVTRAGIVWWV